MDKLFNANELQEMAEMVAAMRDEARNELREIILQSLRELDPRHELPTRAMVEAQQKANIEKRGKYVCRHSLRAYKQERSGLRFVESNSGKY